MRPENKSRRLLLSLSPLSLIPIIMLLLVWQNQPCISSNRFVPNQPTDISDTTLHVPLNFIVASGESIIVSYDETDIHRFVAYSNDAWEQAGISFEAKSIKYITVPDWRAKPLPTNKDLCQFGKDFLGAEFEDGVIDIVYVKDFQLNLYSAGGVTLVSGPLGAAFVEEFEIDYRANYTLAHELGHTLNLKHVDSTDNLMFDAGKNPGILEDRSTSLTPEQIMTARQYAYTFRCPELSCLRE